MGRTVKEILDNVFYNSSDKKKEDDENECWYYCT